MAHLQQTFKVVVLHYPQIFEVAGFKGKGHPSKNRKPDSISYRNEPALETRPSKIQKKIALLSPNCVDITVTAVIVYVQKNNAFATQALTIMFDGGL